MKLFLYLFGMAGAALLGYYAEPDLRYQLTGIMPAGNGVQSLPPGAIAIDIASLTPEQLPARVLLKSDVKVTDTTSGVVMIIPAGNLVKLVRLDGNTAVVSSGEGQPLGTLPVTETDLLQQLAANPPVMPSAPVPTPATGGDSEEPSPAPAPPPVPEPAPAPAPPPVPEPVTAATPEPMPATPTEGTASADPVLVMQESIKSAQIKEFTADQVLEWNAGPDETVDGETFQTGIASYKTETIFGVKTIQAKALIKGGKVARWIWPKSGMEIK